MKNINYKKEIIISSLAIGAVSFILFNLQSPTSKKPLQREISSLKENTKKQVSTARKKTKNTSAKKKKLKKHSFEEKLLFTLKKINSIESCLEDECTYADNDPREYVLSVYKDLSTKIGKYKNFWVKSWSKLSANQKSYILNLLAHDDGHVKAEVLSLLSALPKEEAAKHVDLVLEEVINYHDSKLIPEAMALLKTGQNTTNEVKVSTHLSKALKQGSPHVSQEISKGIYSFLSPNTALLFEETLPQLPESAPETTYLTSALTEYEMKSSGG